MDRVRRSSVILALLGGLAPTAIITAGAAVGLFFSRLLSDFVPDALAIGACMFAAGGLAGLVIGILIGLRHRTARGPDPAKENGSYGQARGP
jgi:hypothetical protein